MTKLKKEELLEKLGIWYITWTKEYITLVESRTLIEEPESKQAYQQIKEMIQASTNLRNKSLGRLAEDLGVSFSATKIISDHAQPQVTEEWIEGWEDKWTRRYNYSGIMIDEIKQMLKEAGVGVSG